MRTSRPTGGAGTRIASPSGCWSTTPENRFSEYLKIANIKESHDVRDPKQILPQLLDSLRVLVAQERKVAAAAEAADDIVTGDLISDLLDEQEKSIWMLSAYEG